MIQQELLASYSDTERITPAQGDFFALPSRCALKQAVLSLKALFIGTYVLTPPSIWLSGSYKHLILSSLQLYR